MRFATKAIRVAQTPDKENRAVMYPIYQTTTFAWDQVDFEPETAYSRVNNPNRTIYEKVLASMENGKHCTVFSSGMAAVVSALSLLQQGDDILIANDIYGGTHRYVESILPRQGVTHSVFDPCAIESIVPKIRPTTKMLIFESPTNPLMKVCDIQAITRICREFGILSVFDNTFASPALQNPLDLGVDIIIHSTTKYIGGHSDVVGGALITNSDAIAEHTHEWIKNTGACPSPFDCWLALRGAKTLELRMARHCENGMKVAQWLKAHPKVDRVYYPGLEDHPTHEIAKKQMTGFGGMLSVEIGDEAIAKRVGMNTRVFLLAESLGGVESLIGYPPLMSHGCMSEDQRMERGIRSNLLRLSVGIEDPDDLIEDLDRSIENAFTGKVEGILAATPAT